MNILKRLWFDGSDWLYFMGCNVAEMRQNLLPGDLIIDPPISEEDITVNSDDASQGYPTQATMNLNGLFTREYLGNYIRYYHSGWRFQTLPIGQGDTVNSATLEPYQSTTGGGSATATLYGNDVDDAGTFTTTASDISNRTRTTASTSLTNSDWPGNNTRASWDVQSIVQEIVNRGGWASDNDMAFVAISTNTTNSYLGFTDYNSSAANAADFNADVSASGVEGVVRGRFGLRSLFDAGKTVSSVADGSVGARATADAGKTVGGVADGSLAARSTADAGKTSSAVTSGRLSLRGLLVASGESVVSGIVRGALSLRAALTASKTQSGLSTGIVTTRGSLSGSKSTSSVARGRTSLRGLIASTLEDVVNGVVRGSLSLVGYLGASPEKIASARGDIALRASTAAAKAGDGSMRGRLSARAITALQKTTGGIAYTHIPVRGFVTTALGALGTVSRVVGLEAVVDHTIELDAVVDHTISLDALVEPEIGLAAQIDEV